MAQQIALFNGVDASGLNGLWVTNGTAANTYELTGIAGVYAGGLSPQDFTVFNNEVLFYGIPASYYATLWVTNGTAAGTYAVTGISGANANNYGLAPSDLTVFGGEVLFAGTDSSGVRDLWVTGGTGTSTYKLSIAGAYSYGISPQDITVLGNVALFDGLDSNGNSGLWKSDGTGAGQGHRRHRRMADERRPDRVEHVPRRGGGLERRGHRRLLRQRPCGHPVAECGDRQHRPVGDEWQPDRVGGRAGRKPELEDRGLRVRGQPETRRSRRWRIVYGMEIQSAAEKTPPVRRGLAGLRSGLPLGPIQPMSAQPVIARRL